ncbi:hypothetical protein [Acidaminococcus intestini]|uniref:hypothetical protein n=1 Tax=Acidaminococcus intestini TaxID=187327 RepID=UPI00068B674B|nr:hypothetical protein [Acidaminococcus intestini]
MGKGETYEEFVDKFKSKLTTDDCYTPENVYETVKAWAIKEYEWGGETYRSTVLARRRLSEIRIPEKRRGDRQSTIFYFDENS